MRRVLRKILFLLFRPYALWRISDDCVYRYRGIEVKVPKGIFHPGLFFSTEFLLSELQSLSLTGKTFLELGSGSGLISVAAAKQGALVTAVDINPKAVETTKANAVFNNVTVETVQSDLFSALTGRTFDVIAINPPYFKKAPSGNTSAAWFAGEEYEYFQKLFQQLGAHMHANSPVLMVVSEDVDMASIQRIAGENSRQLSIRTNRVICFELNFIYEIR